MTGRATRRLSDAERLDWLRLIRSENIGPQTFRALIARYRGAARALEVVPELARRGGAAGMPAIASRADAQREMEAGARLGVRFVGLHEPEYPEALAASDGAPPLIAVRGNIDVLSRPMVAIVGSRNASAAGLAMADAVARGLAHAGLVVVSGLARGIDAKAHQASLEGGTVAVLAGGHDQIYPPENEPLLRRILERGAAVSEMPLGWRPRGRDFPRRNRIVAGLAYATVVVEAALRSGSLITARLANEQGREVFAVPGSPLDPRAEGTNGLLKQGASVCTCAQDIISAVHPTSSHHPRAHPTLGLDEALEVDWHMRVAGEPSSDLDEDALGGNAGDGEAESASDSDVGIARRVVTLLGPSPIGIDELARACGVPVREVQQVLLELELAGQLVRHGNNRVSQGASTDQST